MPHDSRSITRRTAFGLLGASLGTAHNAAAQADAMRFASVDHLEFFVSDVQKSAAFYAKIFGNNVLKNNRTTRRYVKLGSAYMAIDQGPQIRVDHICAGVPGFQVASAHKYLEQRGIEYRDYPSGRDLSVGDPDGNRLQLAASGGWSSLPASTPEAGLAPGEPIFQPVGIDHLLINVSEPEKAAAFYERILGPVSQRAADRIWFQVGTTRFGLTKTPGGQKAGLNHFCVMAGAFDYETSLKKLAAAGAKLETTQGAGEPAFRDPDGYRVQVARRQ
jgi:catechol 2,3-dioxygenase-like lactoylglutathione lyase family enzyme